MHTGGSSPFNKKQWVIKEWPMCSRAITVSSSLFVRGQTTHCFNTVIYFLGAYPTQTATILIYICWHMILSLKMDELNRGVANTGIFVCSWITPNAHIARDPDNLLPIFGQIHI